MHVFYYFYLFKGDTKYDFCISKRNYLKLKTTLLPSSLYEEKKPKILDFCSFELILVVLSKK